MSKGSFFQNIIDSFFGGDDALAIKRRILKKTAKNLSKTKYHFYKAGSHEIDPSLAKFFYEIYKAISPAQLMFANVNPNSLKRITIDLSLSDSQKKLLDELSEEAINEKAKSMKLEELRHTVSENLDKFNAEFTTEKITKADMLYTKLILLKNFTQHDFYFFLKKFDSSLKERNFTAVPRFQTINGSYIVEDIKNFVSVAWVLPMDAEWDDVFKLLKALKGVEPITVGTWKKVLTRLRNIKDHRIFEMIIQLITENPSYRENVKVEEYHIMDDFISQTRKTADGTLEDIKAKQTAGKVDNLVGQVFGNTSVEPLKFYTDVMSENFTRRGLDGFVYSEPMSYLRQFLLDYVKKDLRELADILVVRGEWATQALAKPMSESSHQLMEASSAISKFDEQFSDNSEFTNKMKTLLPRIERDREAHNIAEMLIHDANNDAARILISSRQNLVAFARNLKMVLEDFVKSPHSEIIINWKELDHFAEGKLKPMCIDVYKKIFSFVSLIQNFEITIEETN